MSCDGILIHRNAEHKNNKLLPPIHCPCKLSSRAYDIAHGKKEWHIVQMVPYLHIKNNIKTTYVVFMKLYMSTWMLSAESLD